MMQAMPTRIEVDSNWYFLPKKWLTKWELYCYVDIINVALDDPSVNVRNVERRKPGPIPFSELFVKQEDNQLIE